MMYYEACDMAVLRFYYMLMRCYDIIPLRVLKKLFMHVLE